MQTRRNSQSSSSQGREPFSIRVIRSARGRCSEWACHIQPLPVDLAAVHEMDEDLYRMLGDHKAHIGKYDLRGDEVVDCQAKAADQRPVAADQSESSHADGPCSWTGARANLR